MERPQRLRQYKNLNTHKIKSNKIGNYINKPPSSAASYAKTKTTQDIGDGVFGMEIKKKNVSTKFGGQKPPHMPTFSNVVPHQTSSSAYR